VCERDQKREIREDKRRESDSRERAIVERERLEREREERGEESVYLFQTARECEKELSFEMLMVNHSASGDL
jgi:hypothetical protein